MDGWHRHATLRFRGGFCLAQARGAWFERGADLALNGAVNRATAEAVGSRSQALEAIRNGRFEHAYEFYRSILEAQWRVDDCLTLGSALLERDQLVLGWAAVEAAHRIDSKHEPSVRALDAPPGQTDSGNGQRPKSVS